MTQQKNEPVVIERTGNGYMVKPLYGPNELHIASQTFVFQDKGLVIAEKEGQPPSDTLFGWLTEHFSQEARK